ncbi:hypothetical protein ISF_02352 [Cordyceps fumosorosea ARSEF 2679]|uniref:Uncharacterized protein n=1 Tax=Cordyceps fumosorosea (strain ARSEF 2679) TaxID=1081104 RepID=A0A168BPE8_CORFA|nr:hypothetical protein ISF_02352 [Cordyceps fumosorosea ARSEF 2679]OAA70378.1 hypothetical protein ISF_02352 [Cordyceps fumosorosea ARSEF 2679]
MAPLHINLSETSRWLAQLHTTNLIPADGAPTSSSSASSSTRSRGRSVDLSPTTSASSSSGSPTSPVDSGTTTCLLTESRARSLQRLCDLSDVNARFSPTNINYVKTAAPRDKGASPTTTTTTTARSRWYRKASGQSLEALEGSSMRKYSFSKFRLR